MITGTKLCRFPFYAEEKQTVLGIFPVGWINGAPGRPLSFQPGALHD